MNYMTPAPSSQPQCPHVGTLFQSRGLPCWFSPSLGSHLRAFAHACCWVASRYPLKLFPLSVPSALLHCGTFYSPFLLWFCFFHLSPPDNPISFTYLGFVFSFGCTGSLLRHTWAFSTCSVWTFLVWCKGSSCAWASHCVDFSCRGTQALEHVGSLVAPKACGILVPKPGIEPMSPAVEGGFLTTGPLGKSLNYLFSQLPLP